MSQTDVADLLGTSQGALTAWENARALPDMPETIWKLEEVLQMRPGALSRLLGYLPVTTETTSEKPTFEEAVTSDPLLSPDDRDMLLEIYKIMISKRRAPAIKTTKTTGSAPQRRG
jgi:transcriptional regulator with XRE-family HTH domain